MSGKDPITATEKIILSEFGFDVLGIEGSGDFGVVYKGVCNEKALKRYEIQRHQIQEMSALGKICETETMVWLEMSLNGKYCAIKWLDTTSALDCGIKDVLKEAQILRDLNHPNIVEIYYVLTTQNKNRYIITEYINGGNLETYFQKRQINRQKFSELELKKMFTELVEGLRYLHKNSITHSDLYSKNIMLHIPDPQTPNQFQLKLIDFGWAEVHKPSDPKGSKKIDYIYDIQTLSECLADILSWADISLSIRKSLNNIVSKMTARGIENMEELSQQLYPILSQMPTQSAISVPKPKSQGCPMS